MQIESTLVFLVEMLLGRIQPKLMLGRRELFQKNKNKNKFCRTIRMIIDARGTEFIAMPNQSLRR